MAEESAEDAASLHARIFGSDDEDDVEVAPPSAGKKRLQKGAPSSSGGGGKKRRSAPDADEMAAAGAASEARQLEKRRKKEEARRGEGGEGGEGEGGAAGSGAAGGADDDDPDEDSVDGDEAIEEGSKKDMNKYFKTRGGKIELSLRQRKEDVDTMIEKMEKAADLDDEALGKDPPQPAIYKAKLMPEVMTFMQKGHYHETLVDQGMLQTISRWLKPTIDGALVSLTVRSGLLKSLQYINADDTLIGSLRSSKIGVYVKLLTMHRKETDDNRRMAVSLVEKWSRPIFGSSVAFRSQEVAAVLPRYSAADLAARAEKQVKEAPADAQGEKERRSGMVSTGRGTSVPRPLGMDFHVQPMGQAQAQASKKYAKDSTKGKLQDKLIGTQKRVSAARQAETLSVEGRSMDRV